jgi:transcriptional regulator with XRE-family HTH domain
VGDDLHIRIRQARTAADLSREAIAAELGVSLATIVRMETGRTRRISVESLRVIARVTGKPLGWFLSEMAA